MHVTAESGIARQGLRGSIRARVAGGDAESGERVMDFGCSGYLAHATRRMLYAGCGM